MKQRPVKKASYIQSNLPVHCNLIAFGVSAKLLNFLVLLILEINQVISQEKNIPWEIFSLLPGNTIANFSQRNKYCKTMKFYMQFQGIFNSSF